jgi:SulP family sulfate permease
MPDGSATAHLYRPKLATTLREGYGLAALKSDVLAGLTVAIVALPLSMAIAVASGVSPERGLYAAVIGGFLVSALGGSRYQIGGPAGAFIVLVAATVAQFGLDGLLLTILLSGAMLTLLGVFRAGALIRYIPHAVTVGFTLGIALIILASQIKDLLGLSFATAEPGQFFPKLAAIWRALPTVSFPALAVGAGSAALILVLQRWRPAWPGMLFAVVGATLIVYVGGLPLETIGSRFGAIPQGLPTPQLPVITLSRIYEVLPAALAFTLLGGIESLLSAKIADGMTGRKHRYHMELTAQGIANVASAVFGGISVTGTIARTATNIRAGARSPVAGMLHAAFLFAFMLIAAPLLRFVPLAALAGVLVVVSWNMAERHEALRLARNWRTALVLALTLGLTLAEDLTYGIVGGCCLAALLAVGWPLKGPEHAAKS